MKISSILDSLSMVMKINIFQLNIKKCLTFLNKLLKTKLEFFMELEIQVILNYNLLVDVLNGILSGIDLFEGEYPLELA